MANWFTDKMYDLAASPRGGEGAWNELAAQDAMSPATRANYYAGSEMPKDLRAQGWAGMGSTMALPDPRMQGWQPKPNTFDERFAPMGQLAAQDSLPDSPFERAAMRTARRYRKGAP